MVQLQKPILLIVDDDQANLDSYSMGFARQPYTVRLAGGGAEAVRILREEDVDIVVTDLKMPEVDGMEVVRAAASKSPPAVCIVTTAYGTIESAVEAMRQGAFDYLSKPVNFMELRAKVEKAMEIRSLRMKGTASPRPTPSVGFQYEGVIGRSANIVGVIEQAKMVAQAKASVLIEGESGTGKEVLARAIHFNSPRSDGPFVPIHCAALPETLLESELFGHEKGAFTGAQQQRIGKFESANGGTVFLDELAEIPLPTQVKLLRVLEQREITRVGATSPVPIDIRLVTATNKDLDLEVQEGRFREDLYYRLNVVRLHLPPLRERLEDIPLLADHFLEVLSRENGRPRVTLTPEAVEALTRHPWYGNIRELRNVMEQIVVFAKSDVASLEDLPASLELLGKQSDQAGQQPAASTRPGADVTLAELEREHLMQVLEQEQGHRTRAAKKLGISRRTLQRKLKEMGLNP